MTKKSIKITRKRLYEQVWSKPMTKLSQRYGLSDVGLAKICRKNNIPRPPRGYWARVQSGQKITKTPLPGGDDNRLIEIGAYAFAIKRTGPITRRVSLPRLKKDIVVPEQLTEPNPLVEESARRLESRRPDATGIVIPPKRGCLNIRVSRAMLPKALRVIDTVIKTLLGMGHDVSVTRNGTAVKVQDMVVYIGISEELIRRRLKAKDHNLEGHYEFGFNLFEKIPTPTGNLILEIIDQRYPWKREMKRQKWRDLGSIPLGQLIKRFVTAIVSAAALRKAAMELEQQANAERTGGGNE